MDPLVSAIVLNFNGEQHLTCSLPSLTNQTYHPLEILVVDNGSTDGSIEVAQRHDVRWEPLGRNHGFAPGNNMGAERACGEILVFVNNDMRFEPTFIEELVRPLLESDDVFATDGRQSDWDGEEEIHLATRLGRRRLRAAWGGNGSSLPRWEIEQFSVGCPSEAVQACAANMAVRRIMFEHLGGFDDRLPAGWEDTDVCWRAWLSGWRTVFVPTAVCWHRVGATSSTQAGQWIRYRGSLGGRLLFATKHLPIEDVMLTWLFAFAGGLKEIIGRTRSPLTWRVLVLLEFGRQVPRLLVERRRIYRQGGVSPRQHLRRLAGLGSPDVPSRVGRNC